MSRATAAASSVASGSPVPPGWAPPAVSSRIRSTPGGEVRPGPSHAGRDQRLDARPARSLGRQVDATSRSAGRDPPDELGRLVAGELDDVRVERGDDRLEPFEPGVGGDRHDPRLAGRPSRPLERGGPARRPRRARGSGACPARGSSRSRRPRHASAARIPAASVIPQILTNGARSAAAGSSGSRPAAANRAAAAAGSAERISASPMSAASKPSARQPASVPGSRTPDSATTRRSVRHELAQPHGPLGVDRQGPQVAVVQADQAGPGGEGPLELALDRAPRPAARGRGRQGSSTRRPRPGRRMEARQEQDEVRPGRSAGAAAAADRPRTPWPGPAR